MKHKKNILKRKQYKNKSIICLDVLNKAKCFSSKLTRHIALTYHKITKNLNIYIYIDSIINAINKNIDIKLNYKVTTYVCDMIIQKEPYDIKKNKENINLCHMHVLISLNRAIDLRKNTKLLAECFTFNIANNLYYPHFAPVARKVEYIDYITKLHTQDNFHSNDENYINWTLNETESLITNVEEIYKQNKFSGASVIKLIQETPIHLRDKLKNSPSYSLIRDMIHISKIDMNNNINNYIVNNNNFEFNKESYSANKNYNFIESKIFEYLPKKCKHSLAFIGKSNIYKTSMVLAAVMEYQKLNSKYNMLIVRVTDLEAIKCLNKIDQTLYSIIIIIIDDIDFNKDLTRNEILQTFEGNEYCTNIKARFENIEIGKNIKKIFIHNYSFIETIINFREELKNRLEEIKLD